MASPVNAPSFSSIPTELALHVFSYLNVRDLERASRVSRAFNALASDNSIWEPMTRERFGANLDPTNEAEPSNWKQIYQTQETQRKAQTAKLLAHMEERQQSVNEVRNIFNRQFHPPAIQKHQ